MRRDVSAWRATWACALVALVGIAGCGGSDQPAEVGDEQAPRAATSETAGVPALDACAIITAADAGALLSAPIENAQEVVSNADATRAVSQCVASTAGPRSVSVLISYSASDRNPTTKEEWIAAERDADLLGLGAEAAAALASAEELPGLGDLAVAYELFGQNVAVFWEGRYRMIVSVNGMPDRPAALEVARALARTAMDRH